MIKLGQEIEISGMIARLVEICDEPDTGLVIVGYNNWNFTMPVVFFEELAHVDTVEGLELKLLDAARREGTKIRIEVEPWGNEQLHTAKEQLGND